MVETTKPTPIQVADEMIAIFCSNHGGLEYAMPIIRQQFQRAGIDFYNPTKEKLAKVIDYLIEAGKLSAEPEVLNEEKRIFIKLVRSLD